MPSLTFNDASVTLNAVDLSAFVTSVTITYSAELLDETAMGDTTRKNKGGLKDWSVDVEFKQDFAAGAVDVSLFALVGTTFPVVIRPVKGTVVSATNPNYTGTGILESYAPVGNTVGDLAMAPVSIQAAGPLTRAVA